MNWLIQLIERIFCWIPRIWLVNPDEGGVRITLGSRYRLTSSGWYIYWPLIQECRKIDIMPQVIDLRAQSVFTKDHENLCIGGGIMYRVDDPVKAILKVQDFDKSLYTLALGIIANYISQHNYSDYNDNTVAEIRETVLKGIRDAASGWGLKIMRIYITDIGTARNIRMLSSGASVPIIDDIQG